MSYKLGTFFLVSDLILSFGLGFDAEFSFVYLRVGKSYFLAYFLWFDYQVRIKDNEFPASVFKQLWNAYHSTLFVTPLGWKTSSLLALRRSQDCAGNRLVFH